MQDAALLGLEGRLARPSKAPSFRRETSIISRTAAKPSTTLICVPPDRGGVARRRVPRRRRLGRAIHASPPHAVDATSKHKTRRDKLPLVHGASLINKNLPFQDQFNIIEDLMLAFCEKAALLPRSRRTRTSAPQGISRPRSKPNSEADFETIEHGQGRLWTGEGLQTLRTGKMYALKEMDLKHVTKKKAGLLCDAEHACLTHPVVADSPFIVSLDAFQSAACWCWI